MAMAPLPRGWVLVEVVRWRAAGWTAKHSHRQDNGAVSCREPTRWCWATSLLSSSLSSSSRGGGRGRLRSSLSGEETCVVGNRVG